jgi:DNA-binding CsgD family transcriptional regulator
MGKSNRLCADDVAGVFRLVHECRELWADVDAWQDHLLQGACELTGMAGGAYNELRLSPDGCRVEVVDEADGGWRYPSSRALFQRMFADHADRAAFMPRVTRLARAARDTGRTAAATRPEMRPDREWRTSGMFNDYRRPAHLDGYVMAFTPNPHTGTLVMLCGNQDLGDRAPTQRTKGVLALLNGEVAPLVGNVLTTRRQRGIRGLSPRLRQTLDALLAGRAEKQIALELSLRMPTVHEYVGAIYRHFGVAGRSELSAYFLRRSPGPWRNSAPPRQRQRR